MQAVQTHILKAITPDGRKIELGRMASPEQLARLKNALEKELGDEYWMLPVETETAEAPKPAAPTVRSLRRDELCPTTPRKRRAASR